ncbi:MAG: hypothetical protein V1809_08375 [Planctomycetota bacterium]
MFPAFFVLGLCIIPFVFTRLTFEYAYLKGTLFLMIAGAALMAGAGGALVELLWGRARPVLWWILAGLLSAAWAAYPLTALRQGLDNGLMVLGGLVAAIEVRRLGLGRFVRWWGWAAAGLAVVVLVFQGLSRAGMLAFKWSAVPFDNPTVAASFFIPVFAFGLAAVLKQFSPARDPGYVRRVVSGLAVCLLCVMVAAACEGRGALVGMGVAAIVVVWVHLPRLGLGLLAGGLAAVIILPNVIPGDFWGIRPCLWGGSVRMALANGFRAVLGWGSGNFWAVFPDYRSVSYFAHPHAAEQSWDPHNIFLLTLVELGIAGVVLFLWVLRPVARSLSRGRAPESRHDLVMAAAVIGLLADGCVSLFLSVPMGRMLLWTLLGLLWLGRETGGARAVAPFAGVAGRVAGLAVCGMALLPAVSQYWYSEGVDGTREIHEARLKARIAGREKNFKEAVALERISRKGEEKVLGRYRLALAFFPDPATAVKIHYSIAKVLREAGEWAAAETEYRVILGGCRDYRFARRCLGMVVGELGRNGEAAGTLLAALRRNPLDFDAYDRLYLMLGVVKEDPRVREEAIRLQAQGLALLGGALVRHPGDARILKKRDALFMRRRAFEEAGKRE